MSKQLPRAEPRRVGAVAPIAPCEYSAYDLYSEAATEALSSADILFSYSVTWSATGQAD